MKIKMKQTHFRAEDGFSIQKFESGKEYEVRESFGCRMIRRGYAIFVPEVYGTAN